MKLKKASGSISEKFKEPAICESCGAQFNCGAKLKSCWCMNVELTDENREEIKSKFKSCLCRKCLENYDC